MDPKPVEGGHRLPKNGKGGAVAVLVIQALLIFGMLLWKKPFSAESASAVCGGLSDCFFVPGILYVCVAGLGWVASKGGYDTVGYVFSDLGKHTVFPGKYPKKYPTLSAYRAEKDKKGRKCSPLTLLVGTFSALVGVLFWIIYQTLP